MVPHETAIAAVLADVIRRRTAGENISDDDIIATHPALLPRLRQELDSLSRIRMAHVAARRAGIASTSITLLSDEELERPIESDLVRPDELARLPQIEGYVLFEELGSGGQATVFRARQESTGQIVAIKILLGGAAAGSRNRARFDREASILARIKHPSMARIIDRGQTRDGAMFIAMDFVDGVPLDRFVNESSGPPNPSLTDLWLKIIDCVSEAHKHNVIHRDLKPSNILVDKRGEPHVLDFGLAAIHDEQLSSARNSAFTMTGQVLGSLPWTSPEQSNGSHSTVSFQSDIYALGVIFYETVAGSFPYPVDGTIGDTLKHIAFTKPRPPSQVAERSRYEIIAGYFKQAKRVTASLDAVILKSLAKTPEERYSSAAAFAADIRNSIAGHSIHALKPRPHLGMAIVLSVLCVLIALGSWRSAWQFSPSAPANQFQHSPVVNDFEMSFIRIAPQTFRMGSLPGDQGHREDETAHFVAITKPFYIQTTEINRQEYYSVMNLRGPSKKESQLPVTGVTWNEAVDFCRTLESRDHHGHYRLPTEAEWELACYLGVHQDNEDITKQPSLNEVAWFDGNSGGHLHAVGLKQPSALGLFDMQGCVQEWCSDFYSANYDTAGRQVISNPTGPLTGNLRVLRGGSFRTSAESCRPSARSANDPLSHQADVGFRIVMEIR